MPSIVALERVSQATSESLPVESEWASGTATTTETNTTHSARIRLHLHAYITCLTMLLSALTSLYTTKVCVVYDALAKSDGPSLNECFHTGPKFNQQLLDILLHFRHHRVALTADVEKVFLMISVAEPDRDSLRFLWVEDIAKDPPAVCMLRLTRVVSSSPFLLNATIK